MAEKYNRTEKSRNIAFKGNMISFSQNHNLYGKRHIKNNCCGIVEASLEQINDDSLEKEDDRVIVTVEGIQYIDNMVQWYHNGNTIYICAVCGFIDNSQSKIQNVMLYEYEDEQLKKERKNKRENTGKDKEQEDLNKCEKVF